MVKNVEYNSGNGVLTFTHYNNETSSINFSLEQLTVSGSYYEETKNITFTLPNGSSLVVPLGELVPVAPEGNSESTSISNVSTESPSGDKETQSAVNIEVTDSLEEHGTSLEEHGTSLEEHGTSLEEHGTTLENHETLIGDISSVLSLLVGGE